MRPLAEGCRWATLNDGSRIVLMGGPGSPFVRLWYSKTEAEKNHPECFAPDPPKPKEPTMTSQMAELRKEYKRVQEFGPHGRTLIFRDSEARLGGSTGTRLCWIEGIDEVPDHVYAPEPEQQEFREGDLLRVTRSSGNMEFALFDKPSSVISGHVIVRDASGVPLSLLRSQVERVHRSPSPPKGPPVVGSYVGLANGEKRGVIDREDADAPIAVLHAYWSDGTMGWHTRDELIHLCRSEDD